MTVKRLVFEFISSSTAHYYRMGKMSFSNTVLLRHIDQQRINTVVILMQYSIPEPLAMGIDDR